MLRGGILMTPSKGEHNECSLRNRNTTRLAHGDRFTKNKTTRTIYYWTTADVLHHAFLLNEEHTKTWEVFPTTCACHGGKLSRRTSQVSETYLRFPLCL